MSDVPLYTGRYPRSADQRVAAPDSACARLMVEYLYTAIYAESDWRVSTWLSQRKAESSW